MNNSNYKLILISDKPNKILYQKAADKYMRSIDLQEIDIDKIIDALLEKIENDG